MVHQPHRIQPNRQQHRFPVPNKLRHLRSVQLPHRTFLRNGTFGRLHRWQLQL
ncbi:hypothetical protein [Nostoc sp.]|uniref:hypothetical protein n=1 Tax=Nostoc sp. TaxID=1180 RepID=UPI002FFCFE32